MSVARKNGVAPSFKELVPVETQRAILQSEREGWTNTGFQLEARIRVAQRIGDKPEQIDALRKDLERVEKALMALQDELDLLDGIPAREDT